MSVTEIKAADFEKVVLDYNGVVVVDFYSTDCPPCAKLAPILDQISHELRGLLVKIVKVNIDNAEKLSNDYAVEVVPTVIIFKDGTQVDSIRGLLPKGKLLSRIKAQL